ncbi:Uma2 family endonuclease [Thermoflexibacter ruber]|uniref:Endonuclease, Uma2 family (Restriction endonuclease fold) n=1 Tax=Thermoflexibacter ruber TaxID=1003 RepID=A0A1I2JAE2_9BACT|nr:Uma2 family endonuclease [Thermoflexibacter ruber]SFF51765.1 Endonuclease, Uma2 family (restriction endonuclease fold) [Thermoflexibacter ruber]
MVEFKPTYQKISRDTYLVMEEQAIYKSEYHNGAVVAMAGGTVAHSLIAGDTNTAIKIALKNKKKTCKVFNSDMKLEISAHNRFVYPDGMVVCGEIELVANRKDIIKNPILIIEVLSAETRSYDLGDKFRYYLTLPSLREYVVIEQERPYVQVFFKKEERNWQMKYYDDLSQQVDLESLEISISMEEIYENVTFELKATE